MDANADFSLVNTNGIRLRVATRGTGPLIVLVHGWPESWYSWRHQIPALAAAGYRVAAIDVRGYGGSDKPHAIEAYAIKEMCADVAGVVESLGEKQAILIGHDWGAPVAWSSARLRPDIFRAVVAMSVPYSAPRPPVAPLKGLRDAGKTKFYWLYFQTPGVAEAEFERDVDRTVRTLLYGTGVSLMMKPGQGFWRMQRYRSNCHLG